MSWISKLFRAVIAWILALLGVRPQPSRVQIFVGDERESMSFSINPGQTKRLTAIFSDANGKVEPLAGLPSAKDPNSILVIAPVGTPTVNDAQFQWDLSCPSGVEANTALEVDVSAEGDPTPGNLSVA
jgi:hypothetical protein